MVFEWRKSHSGVSWLDEEEPVLLSPSGKIPSRDNQTVLKVIRMHMQAYNETLNKILDVNVRKSDGTSLANGFMKLVHRENNLKKTLIDIPYASWIH